MTWLWIVGLTVLGLLAAVAAVLVQVLDVDDTTEEWTPATGNRAFLAYHDDDEDDD